MYCLVLSLLRFSNPELTRLVWLQCNAISYLIVYLHIKSLHITSVQSQKGVLKALLVTEDGTVAASSVQDEDIDQLGVLANLQALTGLCTDVSK
jgi:hypothetical protein